MPPAGTKQQTDGRWMMGMASDPFSVEVIYETGRSAVPRGNFADLLPACGYALDLADRIGREPTGDGLGPARWVNVLRAGHLEISISVIDGGLL